ncbi:MAG TPA: DUF4271 domain-containing protein [Ferruginibacter sp.]|nr:DUF4271 domain-containing protein [Ferruginibacter sp.]
MKQVLFSLILLVVLPALVYAQNTDSVKQKTDSLLTKPVADSAVKPVIDSAKPVVSNMPVFGFKNKVLNSEAEPVSLAVKPRKEKTQESTFYLIAAIVLILALLKSFNDRYFTTMFRVFFNTSLRQNQLTDQLLQAKLPSMLFNFFFFISAGLYVYLLLLHYHFITEDNKWILIISSVGLIALIYLVKYCTLKFTGWISGLQEVTNTYVFIIFLINKILGIFLLPFIVVLAFSRNSIVSAAAMISLISIGIFLLLRFFRSYGLLQNQLKISRFHFMLYLIGIELLPLLLIYKGLMVYLTKIL